MFNNKTILLTGSAGFIGANLMLRLLKENEGCTFIGLDNMNAYYDVSIKEYRLKQIEAAAKKYGRIYKIINGNLTDKVLITAT